MTSSKLTGTSMIIQFIRKQMQLSQAQFALKYGFTQQQVSWWESGKNEPKDDQLFRIANSVGILVSDMKADEMIYLKNGVRVLVEGNLVLTRTPVQAFRIGEEHKIRFDQCMRDSAENRELLIKEAEKISSEITENGGE